MVKNHLKKLAMPKTWPFLRKDKVWITRPNPGAHKYEFGIPLNTIIRDILNLTKTKRETRQVLHKNDILVDGKPRKDQRFNVGLMDVISIPGLKKHYRVVLDERGKLLLKEIDEKESKLKISKITGKSPVKGKTQLNMNDGRNILIGKDDYKVGDTLLLELPKQEIKKAVKLEKGALVYLIKGKHTGKVATIEEITGKKILVKTKDGEVYETLKIYAYVLGEKEPLITL